MFVFYSDDSLALINTSIVNIEQFSILFLLI